MITEADKLSLAVSNEEMSEIEEKFTFATHLFECGVLKLDQCLLYNDNQSIVDSYIESLVLDGWNFCDNCLGPYYRKPRKGYKPKYCSRDCQYEYAACLREKDFWDRYEQWCETL